MRLSAVVLGSLIWLQPTAKLINHLLRVSRVSMYDKVPDRFFFNPVCDVSRSPSPSSAHIVVWTAVIVQCWRRMAMRSLVLLLAWLPPLVAADYACVKNSTVLDSFTFDFLRTFQKTGAEVKKKTFDQPNRMMNLTMASKDTRRNVTIWSVCNPNITERTMCSSCIGLLLNGIYDVCCEQRCPSGSINLRADCYLGYSAPDYVIPGWTDPGDLPKEVLKEPKPIDFDAAYTVFQTHKLYLIFLPVLLVNTFFGMY